MVLNLTEFIFRAWYDAYSRTSKKTQGVCWCEAVTQPSTMQSNKNDAPIARAHAGDTAAVAADDKEWKMNNTVVGVYVNAMVFMLALLGGENVDTEKLEISESKTIRQLGRGQMSD